MPRYLILAFALPLALLLALPESSAAPLSTPAPLAAAASITEGTIKIIEIELGSTEEDDALEMELEGACVPACWGTVAGGKAAIAFKDANGNPILTLVDGVPNVFTNVEFIGSNLMGVGVGGDQALLQLIPN